MIYLETERLILRNYTPDDLEDVYAYFSNDIVAEYEDFYPISKEEVRDLIDEWKDKDSRLLAELKNQNKVVGSIGYFIDADGNSSIDFDFNHIYGKQGYAAEAEKKLLDHLFHTLDVKKVFGDCDIRNESSWRLHERLGFHRLSQTDNESYKDDADADGNPIPISIYIHRIGRKAIEIRKLTNDDMPLAMELKISCWTEELAGKAENTLKQEEELKFWVDWMNTSDVHNDIRMLVGAFENSNLLGVAFASFVDSKDAPESGIELNGLWVYPQHRGRGISLKLILEILNYFISLGVPRMEVYNSHFAPSNGFYKKLGGIVIDSEYQMESKLLVDIFEFDIYELKKRLEKTLLRYS